MKLIISGQGTNNREDWSVNRGFDVIMEKQDVGSVLPLIDLSIADWHMSLSFLSFINLLSVFFPDLLPRFRSEYIFRYTFDHLFPIEFNLKFHLIKSLLYVLYFNFSVVFFPLFKCWMWASKHQSHSITISLFLVLFLLPYIVAHSDRMCARKTGMWGICTFH